MTRVAVCQIRIDIDDPVGTRRTLVDAAAEAAAQRASMIILPELAMSADAVVLYRVYAALRKDAQSPPMERCLPGAWQPHGMKHVEWFIPQAAVDHWRELRRHRVDDLLEDVEL